MDPVETHKKIIGVLDEKGPSLPINIAKALEISSLFISAFLSELTNQKRIKVSSLKVGGSPLYYLKGQEKKLEDYYKYLHPRESEAFLLLREHRVLKDRDQDPATRVALRSIKDFSVGFKMDNEIYWRFVSVSKEEVDGILNGNVIEEKVEEEKNIEEEKVEEEKIEEEKIEEEKVEEEKNIEEEKVEESVQEKVREVVEEKVEEKIEKENPRMIEPVVKEVKIKSESDNKFNNPLVMDKVIKKKEKPRSEFVQQVISFINERGLQIVEEKDYKAKEYNCVVQIKSELGIINFLTQAKDKKRITESDFKKLLSNAQSIPLPAFMLYTGEIGNSAKDYLKEYSSVLKAKRIV
ncbi:MAG TPA: hypothetical protein QGG70_01915 [Candidatus Pacearchaeota archaeon]|jgi:hypothetical protein|nr:hypothetical protein [Candidatus Pacearchaeota archaeon]